MEKNQAVEVQETVQSLDLSSGSLMRLRILSERRKAFDGTDRSIMFFAEEALDKGIDSLVRQLESAKTLRGQREVDNWKRAHPAPVLTLAQETTIAGVKHAAGSLNPAFVEYQRTLESIERKYEVGAYKPKE